MNSEKYPSEFEIPGPSSPLSLHIKGVMEYLSNHSSELRQCSPEQALFYEYTQADFPHGPVLYAVKGEHWHNISPQFLDFINNFKFQPTDMGYAECGYGIQRHRDFLKQFIIMDHLLSDRPLIEVLPIEVGCLAMTTRMAMYDLGKIAAKYVTRIAPHKTPVALIPTPSWDYRGIFKDLGFKIVYLPIRPQNSWLPDLREWTEIIRETKTNKNIQIGLMVSNPQHNPTGMQWPIEVTEFLVKQAAHESSYLLLDDAYYRVHDLRVPVANHLQTLLALFDADNGENELVRSGMFQRWMATRPFGKQFNCNSMGVAAITTSPLLLRQLACESWINRYHCNTHNAELMCSWLATNDAMDWTFAEGRRLANLKERVTQKLMDGMGWPKESICTGPSTSYMLFEIPKIYHQQSDAIDTFRMDLFYATGTMIAASLFNQEAPAPYVRLHLGSHVDVIDEMLRRWQAAGLHYHQPNTFPGKAGLKTIKCHPS